MRSIFFIALVIFTNTVFSQAVNGVKTVNGVAANSSGEITISGGSGITLPQLTDSLNLIRAKHLADSTAQAIALNTKITSIVPGTNISVDNTDPANPIVSSAGGGGSAYTLYSLGTLALTTSPIIVPKLRVNLLNTNYTDSFFRFVADYSEGISSGDIVEMRVLDMDGSYISGGTTTVPFLRNPLSFIDSSSNIYNAASGGKDTISAIGGSIAGAAFNQSLKMDSVSLTGSNVYLQSGADIGNALNLNITTGGTVECFFNSKRSVTTRVEALVSKWDDNGTFLVGNYILYKNPSGKIAFSWKNAALNATATVTSTTTISLNTTYHVAVTFTAGLVKLYLNGILEATSSGGATISNTNGAILRVGKSNEPANGYSAFVGSIDEVRISNNARYSSNFTPTTTPFLNDINTLALYHFDAFTTSNTYDFFATVKVASPFVELFSYQKYAQIYVLNQTAARGYLYNIRIETK